MNREQRERMLAMKNYIPTPRETKPGRFFKPRTEQCYACSMPGLSNCGVCRLPLCLKHRIRKAGGNLCKKHAGAQLVQHESIPQTRFKDAGEAVAHETEMSMVQAGIPDLEGSKDPR